MISTLRNKVKKSIIPVWTVVIWLLVWQFASMKIGHEILLVSPLRVLQCLAGLICKIDFWESIAFSFGRIVLGFSMAVILGVLCATIAHRVKYFRELLALPVAVIKSTPVASFIILVLIWIPSRNLSVFISFLMVLPVVYTNLLTGMENMDVKLLEMAAVYRVPFAKRVRYIYISQLLAYFQSACAIALGMCWKAGVAAEIIGIPKGSIGERLYQAKIYLNTPELFAWTVVIIVISILFEKFFLFVIQSFVRKLERS